MALGIISHMAHRFSADRPIGSREEDLLERAPFADSLASAIKGWKGNESLVIALYGPWGSGKSSVKNMVLQSLRSAEADSPLIVEFNPWQWSGQDQLAEAFFREIGLVLGKPNVDKDAKKRAANWAEYAATWKAGSSIAGGFQKLMLFLLGIVAATGLGSGLLEPDMVKVVWTRIGLVALALLVLERIYGFVGTVSEKIASVLEARSKANIRTLAEQKAELAALLRKLARPILVVIDDVDRLSADEIRLLFQLVKANADFPNLLYLLLFQRDIVERSLDSPSAITGREFLEKIVQVGFDIPRIERARLEKVLLAGLEELLAAEGVSRRFDQKRWGNLFIGGLRPYFQTLRDVYRYIASFSFHVSLFRNSGSFEVNPTDLIALEVLRVFESAVYQKLPDAKLELTSVRDLTHDSHDQNERTRKLMDSIVKAGSQPDQVREAVKQLFPPVEWVFNGYSTYGHSFAEEWFRDLRLCHPDVFDRYFHLTIPYGDISQAELDRILSLVGNRSGLVEEFHALKRRDLLGVALDRLEAYKEKFDLSHAVPFVTAMFDIGEELPEDRGGFFSVSPELHASRIIYWYLKQEGNTDKRGEILKEAMEASTGVYLPIMIISSESEMRKEDPNATNVTDADLEELRQVCVRKIKQTAAVTSGLATHPKMLNILSCWREWGAPDEPRRWAESLIESRQGVLAFLVACLHRLQSHGMRDYVSREHWQINLKTVAEFVSPETLQKKVAELSLDDLSEKEKKAVEAFQNAIKRRQEGKSDDDWREMITR